MSVADDANRVAREVFGWPGLYPGQLAALEGVLTGRDTLAVLPTGYGKSAIYQVAGAILPGLTVVVSPLIALQEDQVARLAEHPDAPHAVALNSSHGEAHREEAWQQAETGAAEYLLLAPEQLASEEAVSRLRRIGVALFVVDEAHCVSAWGHDFRPDYLGLGAVIGRLGSPRTLALTATGSPPVREEIIRRLGLRAPLTVTLGFDRPNLELSVRRHETAAGKREAVLEQVRASRLPGLVYAATRRETEELAAELAARDIRAAAYHAGLSAGTRREVHERFQACELDCVVATSAFGMGIDKPKVRFVIHADVPDSVDSYYQEVGRAGRDGEPAAVTLHYRAEDLGLRTFFASGTPDRGDLLRVATFLADANRGVRMSRLATGLNLSPRTASRLANALQVAGAVRSTRAGIALVRDCAPAVAADRALEVAEDRERVDQSRVAMMRGYAETRECRRRYLLGYFGEDHADRCGNCDNCAEAGRGEATVPGDDRVEGGSHIEHRRWGPGTVMSVEDDRMTVFFESEGYKILSLEVLDDGVATTSVS